MRINLKNLIQYTLIIWFLNTFFLFCQSDSVNRYEITNLLLDEVVLEGEVKMKYNRKDYFLLKRRVMKVYPYLDSIRNIILLAENDLNGVSKKRHVKRYTRKLQKKLMNQFREDVMSLSRKEGVVLSKLVYREFNMDVYQIITNYRGAFHAFWWHQISKLYDGDLKSTFNVKESQEDFFIELILQEHVLN